jgi:hypothetical protein
MTLQKKIKLWKISLLHLIQNIKNMSLGSTFKSYEYIKFIKHVNIIHDKLNMPLDNILLCERIYYYLKYNIKILINDSIIHYIKNQKSFSYSNNIDQLYLNVNKYLIISNLIYIEIKKYIIDHKIFNTNSNKISNTNSIILILFFINYMSNKNIKIGIKQIYKILNINSDDNNLDSKINNIQLIIYQIKPLIPSLKNDKIDFYGEINSLTIRFPHAKFYTKYNIYPLIHNDQNDHTNIMTALNSKIITRLKTIENIEYTSKEISNNFNKNYHVNSSVKIGNFSHLIPSNLEDLSNNHFYPFGGINLYAKKYLSVIDNIILNEILHDNIKIKEYFDNDTKQEILTPTLYNLDLLQSTLLKEFKKEYNNNTILEYIDLFLLAIGKEYSHTGYIANSLKKIHHFECKKFILNAQIINPHINLKKFEKELKINQILTMNSNGSDIWLSIRSEFSKHKIENSLKSDKLEQEKNILQYMKIIFSQVLEQKNKLECIPNSLKLFGIIHHNRHRL